MLAACYYTTKEAWKHGIIRGKYYFILIALLILAACYQSHAGKCRQPYSEID